MSATGKRLSAEQKELYNFITTCSPFAEKYEKINENMASFAVASRQLVKRAIETYGKIYGNGNGFNIFSDEDFKVVSNRIIDDVQNKTNEGGD